MNPPWVHNGFDRFQTHSPIAGWRAIYSGGRVFRARPPDLITPWNNLPPRGVLCVVLYEQRTYDCYFPDEGRTRTLPYLQILNGGLRGQDYYWLRQLDPLTLEFGVGNPPQVPDGAVVKMGEWVDTAEFKAATQDAHSGAL